MYVCSLEKCRSVYLEDFVSQFLTHLSGQTVQVVSLGVVGAFSPSQGRMIFTCAGSEFSLSYQSDEYGSLELSREALRSFRWRGSEVLEEGEFQFATPSIEYGFKVIRFEHRKFCGAGKLIFAGKSIGQFESSATFLYGAAVLARPRLVVFVESSRELLKDCWVPTAVFLRLCDRKYLRLDLVSERELVVSTVGGLVEDCEVLGVELSLGSLEMTVGQLLAIREGAIIRFEKPETLVGCVKLADGVLAEVEVRFSDSTVELLVSRLEY
jgi:hypothetical protein